MTLCFTKAESPNACTWSAILEQALPGQLLGCLLHYELFCVVVDAWYSQKNTRKDEEFTRSSVTPDNWYWQEAERRHDPNAHGEALPQTRCAQSHSKEQGLFKAATLSWSCSLLNPITGQENELLSLKLQATPVFFQLELMIGPHWHSCNPWMQMVWLWGEFQLIHSSEMSSMWELLLVYIRTLANVW